MWRRYFGPARNYGTHQVKQASLTNGCTLQVDNGFSQFLCVFPLKKGNNKNTKLGGKSPKQTPVECLFTTYRMYACATHQHAFPVCRVKVPEMEVQNCHDFSFHHNFLNKSSIGANRE
ncbi:hypothetical protein CRM22_008526 [Opisthorchis felineus]|uniref:Uncharacterized protein n=1 Tax=Opisthorchis felineus TaxID=147828 RepID=A0A4S2LAS6_OPIFE|nr:hypothetical protein CRM22_008526 [Opisthorchis felineus]